MVVVVVMMMMGKVMVMVRARVGVGGQRNARRRHGRGCFCFTKRRATVGSRGRKPLDMIADACATTTPKRACARHRRRCIRL